MSETKALFDSRTSAQAVKIRQFRALRPQRPKPIYAATGGFGERRIRREFSLRQGDQNRRRRPLRADRGRSRGLAAPGPGDPAKGAKKHMAKVIGIDLGTTNSCVAVMEGATPKVIEN